MFASRVLRLAAAAGGHGHGHGGARFHGFEQPAPDPAYQRVATAIGASMWLWLFIRAREDGGVLMGWRKPFEHAGHDDHHAEGAHGEEAAHH